MNATTTRKDSMLSLEEWASGLLTELSVDGNDEDIAKLKALRWLLSPPDQPNERPRVSTWFHAEEAQQQVHEEVQDVGETNFESEPRVGVQPASRDVCEPDVKITGQVFEEPLAPQHRSSRGRAGADDGTSTEGGGSVRLLPSARGHRATQLARSATSVLLHQVLDSHWLRVLGLLHLHWPWACQLEALALLVEIEPRRKAPAPELAARLQAALGLYFHWLRLKSQKRETSSDSANPSANDRWQSMRGLQLMKQLIVHISSQWTHPFSLLVHHVLNFSFEMSARKEHPKDAQPPVQAGGPAGRSPLGTPLRSPMSASLLSVAPLITGKLNKHGHFLPYNPAHDVEEDVEGEGGVRGNDNDEIGEDGIHGGRRRDEGGPASGLGARRKKRARAAQGGPEEGGGGEGGALRKHGGAAPVPSSQDTQPPGPAHDSQHCRDSSSRHRSQAPVASQPHSATEGILHELADTVRQALERGQDEVSTRGPADCRGAWSRPPVAVITDALIERLATPHEAALQMWQYEEVLPRKVVNARHCFLAACFDSNPLLLHLVEMVLEEGPSEAALGCAELVRVLLADAIGCWHTIVRAKQPLHRSPAPQVYTEDAARRSHAARLVRMISWPGWLPYPLAACPAIIPLLERGDLPDILFLVWRCMHHAITDGGLWDEVHASHGHEGDTVAQNSTQSPSLQQPSRRPGQGQHIGEEGGGVPRVEEVFCKADDLEKRSTTAYKEWEGHLFAILRRNIAHIGPYTAHIFLQIGGNSAKPSMV
eukprot:jgi/Mesen1/953/ME000012S00503